MHVASRFLEKLGSAKRRFYHEGGCYWSFEKIPLGILVRAGIKDIKDMSFIHFDNM